jgi:hypothetical protein
MISQDISNIKLSENIIIVDADYIDYVAFQLSVQFERMLGRRIPQGDLSRWAMNVALDGGLRADGQAHETQVVLVHEKNSKKLENFCPSDFGTELSAQAFNDEGLGEFLINSYPVGDVVSKDDYIIDLINTIKEHKEVKRVMIIPNAEQGDIYDKVCHALRNIDEDKRVTVFAMQPMQGGNFRQEILGYSMISALGIKGDELSVPKASEGGAC